MSSLSNVDYGTTATAAASKSIAEETTVQNRLRLVRQAVKKATKEALKRSVGPGPLPRENDDSDASFHLGVELFGQEPALVESNIQKLLTDLENELEEALEDLESTEEKETNVNETFDTKSPEELENEALSLREKIAFLQHCSKARLLLDESIQYSTPVLAPDETPDFVLSAQRLVEAFDHADQARKMVVLQQQKDKDNNAGRFISPAVKMARQVLTPIRADIQKQKVSLIANVTDIWKSAVVLDTQSLSVRVEDSAVVTSANNNNGLSCVYDVLETLTIDRFSVAYEILRDFVKTLHDNIFQPLLDGHKTGNPQINPKITIHEGRDSSSRLGRNVITTLSKNSKGSIVRLEWSLDEQKQTTYSSEKPQITQRDINFQVKAWKDTFEFLQTFLVFVAEKVCLSRESLCNFVGARLFGKSDDLPVNLSLDALGLKSFRIGDNIGLLMDPLVKTLEDTCIPKKLAPNELNQLNDLSQQLKSFISPFLDAMTSRKLFVIDPNRLQQFIDKYEQRYIDIRHRQIVSGVRQLILKNDYHNTVEVGVEIPDPLPNRLNLDEGLSEFVLHKSSISDTAFKVLEASRKAMDEAVEQPLMPDGSSLSVIAVELYTAARESLELFRHMIPVTYNYEISNVPRTAAVFHNDCVYLAHHCLFIGLQYRDKFPTSKKENVQGNLLRNACIFVDMVPLFRTLADRSMRDMLRLQASQLVELIHGRLAYLTKSLLSNEIVVEWSEAEEALDAALYHLQHLHKAWKPVLSKEVLNRSMSYLVDIVLNQYLEEIAKSTDISTAATQFIESLLGRACNETKLLLDGNTENSKLHNKAHAVAKFMDMTLVDIDAALSQGTFISFTGQELAKLITATFDDSPKRRQIVEALSAGP